MNPRTITRTLAAVAATATALAGMLAIGGTADALETCKAQPTGTTITIKADDPNQLKAGDGYRQFKFVHVGNYSTDINNTLLRVTAPDDDDQRTIGDQGANPKGGKAGLTAWSFLSDVLNAHNKKGEFAEGYQSYDGTKNNDPMQWVSEHLLSDPTTGAGSVRQFVDTIDSHEMSNFDLENRQLMPLGKYLAAGGKVNDPATQPTATSNEDGTQLTFTLPKGMYLVYDMSGDQTIGDTTYTASKTMLVGTALTQPDDGSCTPLANADGTVNVKNNGTPVDQPKGDFDFSKTTDDFKTPLEGAKFIISKDGKYGVYANGAWTFAEADKTKATPVASKVPESGTDKNALVQFENLPSGTYVVEEVDAPDGYQESHVTFTVTLTVTKKDGITSSEYTITPGDNFAGWMQGEDANNDNVIDHNLIVKNVPVKPSLPLTGGAGVALFAVVAVLLAGGAGVTFVRSRAVKRDLR